VRFLCRRYLTPWCASSPCSPNNEIRDDSPDPDMIPTLNAKGRCVDKNQRYNYGSRHRSDRACDVGYPDGNRPRPAPVSPERCKINVLIDAGAVGSSTPLAPSTNEKAGKKGGLHKYQYTVRHLSISSNTDADMTSLTKNRETARWLCRCRSYLI
jgi:hypothetical protein